MKRARTILPLLFVLALLVPAAAQVDDWKQIKIPELRQFQPQQPVRVQLPNGMVLFLQEDHELPLIDGVAILRGGSREEPADTVGMIDIYGDAWRTGGTQKRTGDELDDFLEARAAKVETNGDVDSTSISFSALKEDFEPVFQVFLELLRQPAFREDKIELAKQQLNTVISRRNDSITSIAGREAGKLAYGADNPYARHAEYATVAAVTGDDLLKWHAATVHPNNIILGIVGDFNAREMEARLRKEFASWNKGPAAPAARIEFKDPKPGVYFIPKDDVNQSAIRMVHLGIRRDHPDYFAVVVMNEVLGGGFSGRLATNIRSKKGLAYAVGGGVGTAFDHPGTFLLSMGTKSESTAAAIDALREEIRNIREGPITPQEMELAKESILNSFVFRFDTKAEVMREKMSLEFYGYPLDFLERFRAGIEKVTAADVSRVAQAHIHPQKIALLVVGKASDFDRDLASFGPVSTLDITIPPPPGGEEEAESAESSPEAKALLSKVIEAMGGQERLAKVQAVRVRANMTRVTPQGEMPMDVTILLAYPDRIRLEMGLPMGEMTMVMAPETGYMSMGGQTQPLPASAREDLAHTLHRDSIFIAKNLDNPQVSVSTSGKEKVGDVETTVLRVNSHGTSVKWYVDPTTGRVLRTEYRASTQMGPVERRNDLSDWRTVEGVTVPFKGESTENGQPAGSLEVVSLEINPAIAPDTFQQPQEAAAAPR